MSKDNTKDFTKSELYSLLDATQIYANDLLNKAVVMSKKSFKHRNGAAPRIETIRNTERAAEFNFQLCDKLREKIKELEPDPEDHQYP